ncbi:hypothetical protein [Maritalea sp.]|uniref:hypothetical protein n=1 Tax=Maritalea sp. TaxID=2003361 RepID=UPI003EF5B6BB
MRRFGFGVVVSVVALVSASPALAADLDYPTEMRGSYNDWDAPADPLMEFEAGLRYHYSRGGSSISTQGITSSGLTVPATSGSTSDTTQFGEVFLRLNDLATDTYLHAYGGYSIHLDANYDNGVTSGNTTLGRMAYAVADFGYLPVKLGSDDMGAAFGGFVGYQYLNDAPTIGGADFSPIKDNSSISWTTGTKSYFLPVDHADHSLNINALRLGVSTKATAGKFDLTAEFAAIPYASVTGVLGGHSFGAIKRGAYTTYKATESKFNGSAWGAAADVMVGYNVTDNVAFRVGGRATYLRGQGNLVYGLADVTEPVDTNSDGTYDIGPSTGGTYYLTPERIDALSLWRYGLLAELKVQF